MKTTQSKSRTRSLAMPAKRGVTPVSTPLDSSRTETQAVRSHSGAHPWVLRYLNPAAREVHIAGSFNEWNPKATPMTGIPGGGWAAEIHLEPGRYEYRLVVDGQWADDPGATTLVSNPFGGLNAVVDVLPPQKTPHSPVTTASILGLPSTTGGAGVKVPENRRWHYKVLKDELNRLLLERSGTLDAAVTPIDPDSLQSFARDGGIPSRDGLLARLSAENNTLEEVTEAIRRIESGTYGICERTGLPIPEARLRAIPWTRFTLEAEQALERDKARRARGR